MGRLAGKRVLMSAAGQGIGRASALMMAAEGAKVFATDINADTLAQLKADSKGDIEVFEMNVLDQDAIKAGVERAQPNVLFNCAGFVHNGTIEECTNDEWDFAFNLNCKSMFQMMQATLPVMLANGGGSIINMSSAASSIMGAPNRFVYGASKAAVIGMTKSVAKDYINKGIRCNCICPGTVESPSLHERLHATGDYEAALKAFIARQPLGRIATAEEIALLVIYLASEESAFTTSQAHVIDGGWTS
ncbi:MAG: SDR family oxidoreductase [Paracoccaceae bacterium]|jgi:2-keto-3-deoxy-L-fuconate dehydrogenase|nr:SDR family oxidoreductase [Paracoccaceae bacterium]MDG1370981.1 SDR family oxidoreductase [Paracoccaceae bacterium]